MLCGVTRGKNNGNETGTHWTWKSRVLSLLIFSTECPEGPVEMFKPKRERKKKQRKGEGEIEGRWRTRKRKSVNGHGSAHSHSFLRHSHSPQPALPSAPWCCVSRSVDCPAVISVSTLEAKSLRIPLIRKYLGASITGCEAS